MEKRDCGVGGGRERSWATEGKRRRKGRTRKKQMADQTEFAGRKEKEMQKIDKARGLSGSDVFTGSHLGGGG